MNNQESIESRAIERFLFENIEDELEALSLGLNRDWKTKAVEPPEIQHGWTDEEIGRFMREHGLT